MEPRIEQLNEKKLIGVRLRMSFADDKTSEIWKSFGPRRKEISNTVNPDLYSVHIYNDSKFFVDFDPLREFDKWAAIEVTDFDTIPDKMDSLVIPQGQYAVFQYIGRPGDAQKAFQYIYGIWLPHSIFEMDVRPYFALMGEKYKGDDPDSEEEFWVPIKNK